MRDKRSNADEADTENEADGVGIRRSPYMDFRLSDTNHARNNEEAAEDP